MLFNKNSQMTAYDVVRRELFLATGCVMRRETDYLLVFHRLPTHSGWGSHAQAKEYPVDSPARIAKLYVDEGVFDRCQNEFGWEESSMSKPWREYIATVDFVLALLRAKNPELAMECNGGDAMGRGRRTRHLQAMAVERLESLT